MHHFYGNSNSRRSAYFASCFLKIISTGQSEIPFFSPFEVAYRFCQKFRHITPNEIVHSCCSREQLIPIRSCDKQWGQSARRRAAFLLTSRWTGLPEPMRNSSRSVTQSLPMDASISQSPHARIVQGASNSLSVFSVCWCWGLCCYRLFNLTRLNAVSKWLNATLKFSAL